MKVAIHYEYTKGGRKHTAEVTTEAKSVAAATNEFKNKFGSKVDKVLDAKEVKKY